jgi:hypothetical protein
MARRLAGRGLAAALAAVAALCLSACAGADPASTRTCAYSGGQLSVLTRFDQLAHTHVTCSVVFDTEQPTWSTWEDPWFINTKIPNENWVAFARNPKDQLIITVNMFPDSAAHTNWRVLGAKGAYTPYARTLAKNLVAAGMGNAIIRLGHEANGTWTPDNVGTTPTQWNEWKQFWRKTAEAMKSVPGAHFRFNWCIANGYRAIPFADYYPGNDLVSSIGVDVYDMGEPAGVPAGPRRWAYQYSRPGGIAAIAAFAKSRGKPLSIPEWGLDPTAEGGGGDDVAFVDGIQQLLRHSRVAFQSYFFTSGSLSALTRGKASLEAYRKMIGG